VKIGKTEIVDTFAEAFGMKYVRLIITANDEYWLNAAISELTGYSSSVIACDAETGLEKRLSESDSPDGRCGAQILIFGFSTDGLQKSVPNRVGQCVMTCPSTAVFDGLPNAEKRIGLGKQIRFFGDGYQKSKIIGDSRYWRIPVMDGEFLVQDTLGVEQGVAGGNVILQGSSKSAALDAARRGAESLYDLSGVIAPFPGGVARSGSKVGSRYKALPASTSDSYCPTLRGRVETKLHDSTEAAYEIVIDGIDEQHVGEAMKAVIHAAAGDEIVQIGAGNYGGELGKFHFHLHELLGSSSE
jgi:formylmethanofuran--tetrahydromethanopterin N-formyltransferase|tara:strand:+ start:5670 stop:6569 length:900 start_codon:yes stop_codon:yes gene_type:complete